MPVVPSGRWLVGQLHAMLIPVNSSSTIALQLQGVQPELLSFFPLGETKEKEEKNPN